MLTSDSLPSSRRLATNRPFTWLVVGICLATLGLFVGPAPALATGTPASPARHGPQIVATIPVHGGVISIATDPLRNNVWVGNVSDDRVTVFDGRTNRVRFVATGVCCGTYGIAVDPFTDRVYISGVDNGVAVIDGRHPHRVPQAVNGSYYAPGNLAINPVSGWLYVSAFALPAYTPALFAIDIRGHRPTKVLNVGVGDIAVNPLTNRVYVTTTSSLLVIDGRTNRRITTIPIAGQGLSSLAINPRTNRVYAALTNAIVVIDGRTNSVVTRIHTAGGFMVTNPLTNKLYVSNYNGQSLSEIDGATNRVTSTVKFATWPWVMAINPLTNTIYVILGETSLAVVKG